MSTNAVAGPSRLPPKRKPSAPHPSSIRHTSQTKRRKLAPPVPVLPAEASTALGPSVRPDGTKTLPIKTLQGLGTKRTDVARKNGPSGREMVMISRRLGVGAYLGRCKSLICDEGYNTIILHAIGAAIPHALIILHALLDVLPYPRHPRGAWYELFTGSVALTDEKEAEIAQETDGQKVQEWLKGLGNVEAQETTLSERVAIHIHIGPKAEKAITRRPSPNQPASSTAIPAAAGETDKGKKKRARPNKEKRRLMALRKAKEADGEAVKITEEAEMAVDEEAAMNGGEGSSDEEQEVVEGK